MLTFWFTGLLLQGFLQIGFKMTEYPSTWTVDRIISFVKNHHISLAMTNTLEFPPPNEHDWSDIDPDPPDSVSIDSSVTLSPPSSVF